MQTILTQNRDAMGDWVGRHAATDLRNRISENGSACLIVATGASQFEVLASLCEQPGIDWSCVDAFHLDEYVGIDADHPASFCGYLKKRFADRVKPRSFHYLDGTTDPLETIRNASVAIEQHTIDVALIGIGENGHLAFNDPPADFETRDPYLLVQLDHACRQQQVGEGWFATIDDVPRQAISMSVQQILSARRIYCSVPDSVKSTAVLDTLTRDIESRFPSTILRAHDGATLVIDQASAERLDAVHRKTLQVAE
ncbi:MAG: glucosamine-6-phosphate deaminase [Planctomycetota bacterium]